MLSIATILTALSSNPYLIYTFNGKNLKKKNTTTIYIYNKTKTHLFILAAFCESKFERPNSRSIIIEMFLYIFICLYRYLSILIFICFNSYIVVYLFVLLYISISFYLYFYSCTYLFICVYICLCSRKKI